MSLELSYTKPFPIIAKTLPMFMPVADGLKKFVQLGDYSIPMDEFCILVEYVLTNTDLDPDDPRLELVNKIKHIRIVDGFQKIIDKTSNNKRLEISQEKEQNERTTNH